MTSVQVEEKIEVKISPVKMYDVVFFNDDYTPMDFVVMLLTGIFKHDLDTAAATMLQVHNEGSAVVGTYIFEIAEEKKDLCVYNAQHNGYPLKVELSESSSEI